MQTKAVILATILGATSTAGFGQDQETRTSRAQTHGIGAIAIPSTVSGGALLTPTNGIYNEYHVGSEVSYISANLNLKFDETDYKADFDTTVTQGKVYGSIPLTLLPGARHASGLNIVAGYGSQDNTFKSSYSDEDSQATNTNVELSGSLAFERVIFGLTLDHVRESYESKDDASFGDDTGTRSETSSDVAYTVARVSVAFDPTNDLRFSLAYTPRQLKKYKSDETSEEYSLTSGEVFSKDDSKSQELDGALESYTAAGSYRMAPVRGLLALGVRRELPYSTEIEDEDFEFEGSTVASLSFEKNLNSFKARGGLENEQIHAGDLRTYKLGTDFLPSKLSALSADVGYFTYDYNFDGLKYEGDGFTSTVGFSTGF